MDTAIIINLQHKEELIRKTKAFIQQRKSPLANADNSFINSLYTKFQDYHSLSTIQSESVAYFDCVIGNGLESDEDIQMELDQLIDRLNKKINQWKVIFPIDNLDVSKSLDVNIGLAKLLKFNELEFGDRSLPDSFLQGHINKIRDSDKTCLVIEQTSSDDDPYKNAINEYEKVINLIRIYMYCQLQSDIVKIGLNEDFMSHIILLSIKKDNPGEWGISAKSRSFRGYYEVTIERLHELKEKYCFNEIDNILKKPSPSKLEIQILLAMKWIGEGIHERDNIDKIIKLTIALECLLIDGNDDKSKTESLAERCAFLLEKDDACKRYKIFKQIKDLYNVRSRFLHDGKHDIEEADIDNYVEKLRDISIRCFFKIIELSSMQDIKDVRNIVAYVDRLKNKCYYEV